MEGRDRQDDGSVSTPAGFKRAFKQYADSGWMGISAPVEFGGQGLPETLTVAVNEMACSANMAFSMYAGLTQGAVAALIRHGTPEQRATYVPPMVAGRWTGTMNLTEPHCGTDLGLLRTKAVKQDDGTYRITGTKIFISAGEHDLAENIVHLVLARIEGAPAGIRGVSLFIVPKILPDPDGALGARNAVSCGALEAKMGIHGNATCVMNYDGATGWLIGAENRGINAMFTMMNEARLGVGVQGLAVSEVAYQNAAVYARDRLQGRALTGAKFPDQPADPLVVHPDVRRMLMTMRAFNEPARALVMWTALQADLAQQIYGGHGYIAEHGMEQFVRDARIAMLYEGANGIQALDLVGRKLAQDHGRALKAFMAEVQDYIAAHDAAPMKPYVGPLATALGHLHEATLWLMRNAQTAPDNAAPDNAAAGATDYLHLMGLVVLGYMWCRIVEAALGRLAAEDGATGLGGKLGT